MPTVAILGTLDTKGLELAYAARLVRADGCDVVLIDVGVTGAPQQINADVTRAQVAAAADESLQDLVHRDDRGHAMEAMGRGAGKILRDLYASGRLDAVLSMGGSGGSSIATAAMRQLPIGVPKLMVSTIASGDVSSYVGQTDITMMYSVLDIAGLNSVSERIFANATAAVAGMAKAAVQRAPRAHARPTIAVSMFGVTTPAVTAARTWLEAAGYEVLVFHANGAGGRAMESLIRDGAVAGCLDLTTTELADELVGGTLSAGPGRCEAAGRRGLPQVVSLGALDMVNFGPLDTVPVHFRGRTLYQHNPNVTLMRTTAPECASLGAIIGRKLNAATGPAAVFIPLRGVSSISTAGKVFHDSAADAALFAALRATLDSRIEAVSLDTDINDSGFAIAMAQKLHKLIEIDKGNSRVQT